MTRLSQQEYFDLGSKITEGRPAMYYFRKQPVPELYLFPFPDSTSDYVVEVTYEEYADDFDAPTNTPGFPPEWLEALELGLAVRVHGEHGILNATEASQLRVDARNAKTTARKLDEEEGDVFFQPDLRR